jgi:murein DD-endopeptidase MepM/ murein hydrolase activator NlpD
MSEKKKVFTFLVATGSTSTIKQIDIPTSLIYTSAIIILLLGLVAIYGTVRLAQHEVLNIEYQVLVHENTRLKENNTVYENQYAKLRGQINFIDDLSRELARQANIAEEPRFDDNVGTGGPEFVNLLDREADRLEHNIRFTGDRIKFENLSVASVPFGFPVNGYQTDSYGMRSNPFGGGSEFHQGIDLAVEYGSPVSSTGDGMVIWAAPYNAYGNLVVLYHSNGITTRYGHLSKISVETGQRIKRGDQIGYAGSTGRSTGPHVHYEIRENDQPVDPTKYVYPPKP